MGRFHGYDSIVSRLQSQNEEAIYLIARSSGAFGSHLIDLGRVKG